MLPFARTVGDEFQGLLDDPVSVLGAILTLMRTPLWHVGLGIGPVDRPLPDDGDPRRARGSGVPRRPGRGRRRRRPTRTTLQSSRPGAPDEAYDVKAVLDLLDTVRQGSDRPPGGRSSTSPRPGSRRPPPPHRLGISRQAVQQRLRAAGWAAEDAVRPTLVRLLARAEGARR